VGTPKNPAYQNTFLFNLGVVLKAGCGIATLLNLDKKL
jgi:hypothetical protein